MELKIGDIQETALITLAIRASETARPNARIKDDLAKEIIDTLGVDVSKYDPFMSHEGVVARTIMYRQQLESLIGQYPDALPEDALRLIRTRLSACRTAFPCSWQQAHQTT